MFIGFLRFSILMIILFCNETVFGMMLSSNPRRKQWKKNKQELIYLTLSNGDSIRIEKWNININNKHNPKNRYFQQGHSQCPKNILKDTMRNAEKECIKAGWYNNLFIMPPRLIGINMPPNLVAIIQKSNEDLGIINTGPF